MFTLITLHDTLYGTAMPLELSISIWFLIKVPLPLSYGKNKDVPCISFENISSILRLRESELSQSSRVDILNSDIDRDYLIYIENGNELKIKTVNIVG